MSFIPNIYETEVEIATDERGKKVCQVSNMSGQKEQEFKMYLVIPENEVSDVRFKQHLIVRLLGDSKGFWCAFVVQSDKHEKLISSISICLSGGIELCISSTIWGTLINDKQWIYCHSLNINESSYLINNLVTEIIIDGYVYSFIDNTPYYNTIEEGQLLFQMICQKVYEGHKMIKEESPIDIRHESL